jgi:hypothetical protein
VAVGEVSYATVEYGGGGFYAANIYVTSGRVTIDHSIIRNSGVDGLRLAFSSRSSASQIMGNTDYGVQPDADPAASDGWRATTVGHSGSPRSDSICYPDAGRPWAKLFSAFLTDGEEIRAGTDWAHTFNISPTAGTRPPMEPPLHRYHRTTAGSSGSGRK